MKTENEKSISQLNNLLEINNDRIQGYERAAEETGESDLKDLFLEMAEHSRKHRSELAAEVTKLGGKPAEGTRNSGKIYRVWMDVKVALTSKDRKAIISSCEFGEDAALEVYEEVLKSDDALTASLREIIIRQKDEIRQDHDKIKALRDAQKV
jgi:uncharacterized protein (TIGR02284 family)